MSEERKTYEVTGTVTISTEEYRDLLIDKFEAIKDKDECSRRNSDYYWKNKELEEKLKKSEQELAKLRKYLKENDEEDSFELWIVRTAREE